MLHAQTTAQFHIFIHGKITELAHIHTSFQILIAHHKFSSVSTIDQGVFDNFL
jgi:hypothetical protein